MKLGATSFQDAVQHAQNVEATLKDYTRAIINQIILNLELNAINQQHRESTDFLKQLGEEIASNNNMQYNANRPSASTSRGYHINSRYHLALVCHISQGNYLTALCSQFPTNGTRQHGQNFQQHHHGYSYNYQDGTSRTNNYHPHVRSRANAIRSTLRGLFRVRHVHFE